MRMLPVLDLQYGEELDKTSFKARQAEEEDSGTVDIYDDTLWA